MNVIISNNLLKKHMVEIVNDVDLDDIYDSLISSCTLTNDNIEYISSKGTRTEKVKKLLSIVSTSGVETYQAFVESLREPYNWLYDKLRINNTLMPKEMEKQALDDIMIKGGVPKLPIHYVKRTDLENDLHTQLLSLDRHNILTLHGMPGSGKTSLVISTLKNYSSLLFESFKGKIFWISVGDCKTDDQITTLQSRLLRKIYENNISMSTSSITLGSLYCSENSINIDQDWKENKFKLVDGFSKDDNKEALLIIDDPRNKQVVEAFDIGCKLLITTQDVAFVNSTFILQVNPYLSETESLELIAKSIDQKVPQLPDQAKKMHQICQGSPLLMAMLGGLLASEKDNLLHNKKRWNHFVKQLKDKSNFISRMTSRNDTNNHPEFALEMCINSLNNDKMITDYKSLTVLPDNIKVSMKALTVILDMKETELEDFIKKLKDKSLIIEHYNVDQKTYEYEIHDLIMSYLKNIHSETNIKKLHCRLLTRYMNSCHENNLANIPDDGYIAYYIGYHISKTDNVDNMWSLFTTLYLDLIFIGNKLRLAGPSDTIEDLNKYSSFILDNSSEQSREFINKLGKFITSHGHDLHRYSHTNIIQSILQYESSSDLLEKAFGVIDKPQNKHHVYFQFLPNNDTENHTVLNVGNEISFVKFWLDYMFIGHGNGSISLWTIDDCKKIKTFFDHKTFIKTISINSQAPYKMGSVCNDGIINIWDIDDHAFDPIDEEDHSETDEFSSVYDTNKSLLRYKHSSGPLCNIVWAKSSDTFLSHTNPGSTIIVYNYVNQKASIIRCEKNMKITCSMLSQDDSLAIIGFENNLNNQLGVLIYSIKTEDALMAFYEDFPVLNLKLLPDENRSILVVTSRYIKKLTWNKVLLSDSVEAKSNVVHSKILELDKSVAYELQTVTIGANGIIFVSTTDCRILVYNYKSDLVCELNNHRGIVSTMDYMEYKNSELNICSHFLITASYGDQMFAKLWFVNISQSGLEHDRKRPIFDSIFNSKCQILPTNSAKELNSIAVRRSKTISNGHAKSKPTLQKNNSLDRCYSNLVKTLPKNNPIIAVIDNGNCVQVFKGNKLIAKTKKADSTITCVALSPCCQYLIYGLENGIVNNFMFKSLTSTIIMETNESVKYMEFLNNTTLVVGGSKCGLMIYEILHDETNKCKAKMLIKTQNELGSQELLDNIICSKRTKMTTVETDSRHSFSSESNSSTSNRSSVDSPKALNKFPNLYKHSPTIKCILIENVGILNIEFNGSIKLWSMEPRLVNVLVNKQDLTLSCVFMGKKCLALCDKMGKFQVYLISRINSKYLLEADKIVSQEITEKILSCTISENENILAMGCESGNIILWHIYDKILLSIIKFHKAAVYSLQFSPTPLETQPSSKLCLNDKENYTSDGDSTPLVLVSLASQVCWWDISYILNKKNKKMRKINRNSQNILSPIGHLISSSPKPIDKCSSQSSNGSSFEIPINSDWEKRWRGKKATNEKRNDLLGCIKLTGERAFKIMTNHNFSTFVTVDQGGVLYVMNVFHDNKSTNGHISNNTPIQDSPDSNKLSLLTIDTQFFPSSI